jgi:recombination protein RecR
MELPEKILNTVESFSKLPGVGRKTATRQVLQMTKWEVTAIDSFSKAVRELSELQKCDDCGFFSEDHLCSICQDEKRSSSGVLCIVEEVTDCMAIEKSQAFNGMYHVLGGVLNPMLGIGPDSLKFDNLSKRIKERGIKEVILALNPSVEGDATCSYIKQIVPEDVKVDRIGFGIPIGGSLEYLDSMTISKALENKKLL